MAVNLSPPDPRSLLRIAGVELGYAYAGIRKANRNDVTLIKLAPGSRVAGVFTQNSFAAAPVQLCREHLARSSSISALVVNAGNANCGTGDAGRAASRRSCEAVAKLVDCAPEAVLPFSTGVILEPLPVDKLVAALPGCAAALGSAPAHWAGAAEAIMTTDTIAKAFSGAASVGGKRVSVTGMAKGVGMLEPNMATMLAFVATDAHVSEAMLKQLVKEVADESFNCVSVDGDTSTNDSFVLIATGQAGNAEVASPNGADYAALRDALLEVAQKLAQAIARDGEGATKFMTIDVGGAADRSEAARVAKRIANSPLVKTAFFASDANLGRLLMAIGNAGVPSLDISRVDLHLGDVQVVERGGRAAGYVEQDGARVMKSPEINVRVELGRGTANARVWTCDFSYDYVKINAEYRT
jgi:glutamate N-acetyltransferase/amino-acid N-acetyltransferase